jgi:hypothetical protein
VLVDERRPGAVVAHPRHQLPQARLLGGQRVAGVP